MKFQVNQIVDIKFIELMDDTPVLVSESEVTDLMGDCFQYETNRYLIHASSLSQDFFDLKTRNAGHIIQKFVNYGCKVALVIPDEKLQHPRMKEFVLEANKGRDFRFFQNREEAISWLVQD